MQAYIKDGNLIINDMIQETEKEELTKFIDRALSDGVLPTALYNIEGNVSGIAFKVRKENT